MRDLLSRMGRAFVVACSVPVLVADEIRARRAEQGDLLICRELVRYRDGELSEARETRDAAIKAHGALVHEIYKLDRKIETKDRELANSRTDIGVFDREAVALRADVQDMTARVEVADRSCMEWKDQVDLARSERNDAERCRISAANALESMRQSFAAAVKEPPAAEAQRLQLIDLLSDRESMLKFLRRELADTRDALSTMTTDRDAWKRTAADDLAMSKRWMNRFIDAADNLTLTYPIGWAAIVERNQWRTNAIAALDGIDRDLAAAESSVPTMTDEAGIVDGEPRS